ncbi:alternative ribosome rescue aminoacyl-tRNA hydrolase ArfB [Segnochrobactraceae bacterium EtOH-i3]
MSDHAESLVAMLYAANAVVEKFALASGPGGQNVNKVSTAVEIRVDVAGSFILPDGVKTRLPGIAGSRMTRDGVLVLFIQTHRSQDRNRQEARERLAALIRQALHVPRTRRPTRPTLGSKKRRLESKSRHSEIKRLRGSPIDT